MPILVRIPTPLRRLTGGEGEVTVEVASVKQLLDALEERFPGMKERLCDEQGQLRRFVNIYINDEDIRFAQGADTALKEGDEVSIVPAIAGGGASDVGGRVEATNRPPTCLPAGRCHPHPEPHCVDPLASKEPSWQA